MSPTSYQTAPPRGVGLHPSNCAVVRSTKECPSMAHVFVTRRLPGTALERLAAQHDVEVWPGDMPPSPEELRARVADVEGLLSLLSDRIDTELLAAAPQLRAVA